MLYFYSGAVNMKLKHTSILVAAVFIFSAAASQAADTPYAGEQSRSIKSLSDSDVAGLLAGQGAGFAKAAELNGYPGPAHTLELKGRLGLSAAQIAATEALMAAHKARARELGASLVQAERKLDLLFALKVANADAVEQASRDVGLLQAQLRAEHLKTHLNQTALLNSEQIQSYSALRGYGEAAAGNKNEHQHKHH
jgi:hypothetical protein